LKEEALDFTLWRTWIGRVHNRLARRTAHCWSTCWEFFKSRYFSKVGWGTALQTGRSRVRIPIMPLEFFIPMALESTQPLTEMSTRNISWRVKAAGA
jgi:hypothetical protein